MTGKRRHDRRSGNGAGDRPRRELRLRRGRLVASGVRVVTIEPGFVRTRMTAGMGLPPLPAKFASALSRRLGL